MQHHEAKGTSCAFTGAAVLAFSLALIAALFFNLPAYASETSDSSNMVGGALAPSALTAQSSLSGELYGATWKYASVPGSSMYSKLIISPAEDAFGVSGVAPESGWVSGSDGYGWAWASSKSTTMACLPPWYGHRNDITDVVIEPGITFIGSYAFDQCSNLRRVTIPSTVKTIGTGAFLGCELPTIEIPEGVQRIGNWAFQGCEFKKVTIPASVKSIGGDAFNLMDDKLKTITFKGDAPAYSIDDDVIMGHDSDHPFEFQKATAYYPYGNDTWTDEAKNNLTGSGDPRVHGILKWVPMNEDGTKNCFDIRGCQLSLAKTSFAYNGKAHEPAVKAMELNYPMKAGTDYTVRYENNKHAGTATVYVFGRGDFIGLKKLTFKITKAANPMKASTDAATFSVKQSKVNSGKATLSQAKVFDIARNKGAITFKKTSGNKKIVVSKTGKITVKKGLKRGTYKVKVKVRAAGNANFKAGSKTVTFKIRVK